MKLSPVEENIFDDLVQDSHELWEWYAFFRYSHPNLSEDEIISRGRDLLADWVGRGWVEALKARDDKNCVSGKELLSVVDNLGSGAADQKKGIILLDLTQRALKDIGNAPSMQEGRRYKNPDALGELVRTQSGFPTANDPIRRGPYAKISKDGKISYTPLADNPVLDKETDASGKKLSDKPDASALEE